MSQCQVCEATTGDAMNLCVSHLTELEVDLDRAGEWAATVWETVSRQDIAKAPSERLGGSSEENPLPFNVGASETLDHLKATLTSWAILVHEEARVELDCTDDVAGIAGYLTANLDWLRKHDAAGDFRDEVLDALKKCERIVDRAEQKVFAGICPTEDCGNAVYAKAGNPIARCNVCTFEWDVTEWRGRALDHAEHVAGTAIELSRWLTDPITLEALPVGTIRSWASRGKLTPIEGEVPKYHIDDVRKAWADSKASKFNPRKVKAA